MAEALPLRKTIEELASEIRESAGRRISFPVNVERIVDSLGGKIAETSVQERTKEKYRRGVLKTGEKSFVLQVYSPYAFYEMDPLIHSQVEAQVAAGGAINADTSAYHPVLWFINGRNAPDTVLAANVPWLPTQPYNCLPRMHAGEKLLMRVVNAGRDLHPLHTHGNNFLMIARDGRMLESAPGAGPDLAASDYTLRAVPGQTYDAIFEWTGKNLGWDIYGHTSATDPLAPNEYAPDHGKPIPVMLPNLQDLAFGAYYSGSPYLGSFGALPPGQTLVNGSGGYFHMWHSHNEREIVNNDIFPGGMMTMLIIEPAGVPIP